MLRKTAEPGLTVGETVRVGEGERVPVTGGLGVGDRDGVTVRVPFAVIESVVVGVGVRDGVTPTESDAVGVAVIEAVGELVTVVLGVDVVELLEVDYGVWLGLLVIEGDWDADPDGDAEGLGSVNAAE